MSDIVIVGAGSASPVPPRWLRILTIIDHDESALKAAGVALAAIDVHPNLHMARTADLLEARLREENPQVVICSTPFHVNIIVAGICNCLNC